MAFSKVGTTRSFAFDRKTLVKQVLLLYCNASIKGHTELAKKVLIKNGYKGKCFDIEYLTRIINTNMHHFTKDRLVKMKYQLIEVIESQIA